MGFESSSENQDTNKILNDYVDLAERSKKEREAEENMPRLPKGEELKIRDRISRLENAARQEMNQENKLVGTNIGGEDYVKQQIESHQRARLGYEAEISRLQRQLRRSEPQQ